MVNLNWIPGTGLLRQAWDATKLAGVILDKKKEKALVLAKEKHEQIVPFKGKNATKKMKEVIEDKNPEEIAKLFLPDKAVDMAKDVGHVYWKIWDIYWIFFILRMLFVLLPLPGYVHPDEYFQTVEVVTGDVFHLDVTKTWEFNVTSPIRSMVIPMAIYGIPLYTLKLFNYLFFINTGLSLVNAYIVLIVPKLVMLGLSFVMDYCVYNICLIFNHSFNRCLTTLSSSYVMLVFSTKTLTNSIEMVLFTILLYMVSHCLKRTSETVFLQAMVQEAYNKADSIRDKVEMRKKKKKIPEHDFKFFLPISVICAAGIFNRPTFAVFAAVPLFYWFQRGISNNSPFTPFVIFHFRMASLIPGFFGTSAVFLVLDSLYYGELTLTKLWELEMSWSDWKLTPLQFILYNAVPGNLDQHGTHPWYTHIFINVPLLFGPLGVSALLSMIHFLSGIFLNEWHKKPAVRTIYAMNMFTFIFSLSILSLIPHQEPRFLIPLTVSVTLMNAHHLRLKIRGRNPLLTLWYIFNIAMIVFYGLLHQGGVISSLRTLGEGVKYEAETSNVNVVFSHTYMPPKFPLLQAKRTVDFAPESHNNKNLKFTFFDLAGQGMPQLREKLLTLSSRSRYLSKHKRVETILILPAHLIQDLKAESKSELSFEPIIEFGFKPNLSMESVPRFDWDILYEILVNPGRDSLNLLADFLSTIGMFRLSAYKVELGDVQSVEMNFKQTLSE